MLLLFNTIKVFLISAWFCNIFAVASAGLDDQNWNSHGESTNRCAAAFSVREDWSPEHFTDPNQHNPQDYKYIVRVPSGIDLRNLVQDALDLEKYEAFSASLISESFNPTLFFAPFVYVLEVPKDNIIASHYDDMWSGFSKSRSDALPLFEKFGLQAPDDLLTLSIQNKTSKKFAWNEIKISGQTGENAVRVIGILYFKSRDKSENSNLLLELQRAAKTLHIPLVMED